MLTVNGEPVSSDLLEETFSRIKTAAEQRLQVSCCERDPEFREEAEREVTHSILISQEADRRFPKIPETEIREQLRKTIERYREHGASWEMLEKQRDSFREEITATLRLEKLIADVLNGDDTVSEAEAEEFYQAHAAEYTSAPEVRALHLMKNLENGKAPPGVFEHLCQLRNELLDGADFLEIAARETEKSTGEVDLHWLPLERPSSPFESVLFSLQVGEISPVLSYEHALHLLQVTERKEERTTPLAEILPEIRTRALNAKKRLALENLAQDLRQSAVIERTATDREVIS